MGFVRKTITLTEQQDAWIKAQVDKGRYASESECIRDLIRCEQARSSDIDAFRQALIEGETSGESRLFSVGVNKEY